MKGSHLLLHSRFRVLIGDNLNGDKRDTSFGTDYMKGDVPAPVLQFQQLGHPIMPEFD